MYQSEALWLSFRGYWKPTAIRMFSGDIKILSGNANRLDEVPQLVRIEDVILHADTQDYLVVPDVKWVDSFSFSDGETRQIVATPLHSGEIVESQITGSDIPDGLQIEFTPSFECHFLAFHGER
ncbi:hypothetical protein FRB95_013973 [Tulasnella sp. JGI-2019a]|nr:hypothetical protein FRB93_011216 [Tulasnella sp. JGI-2019a]KAG9034000.1 hypothetical protein FRB95_013973 [Tulasnella sp. JGI-2019a]